MISESNREEFVQRLLAHVNKALDDCKENEEVSLDIEIRATYLGHGTWLFSGFQANASYS